MFLILFSTLIVVQPRFIDNSTGKVEYPYEKKNPDQGTDYGMVIFMLLFFGIVAILAGIVLVNKLQELMLCLQVRSRNRIAAENTARNVNVEEYLADAFDGMSVSSDIVDHQTNNFTDIPQSLP